MFVGVDAFPFCFRIVGIVIDHEASFYDEPANIYFMSDTNAEAMSICVELFAVIGEKDGTGRSSASVR